MPGPNSSPPGGKTRFNRNKPKHTMRAADGQHKPGSQNRNKNRGKS
jgi:hypothetical protein